MTDETRNKIRRELERYRSVVFRTVWATDAERIEAGNVLVSNLELILFADDPARAPGNPLRQAIRQLTEARQS